MDITRRTVLGGMAATGALSMPFVARAQARELVMIGYGTVQDQPLIRAGEELARRHPGVSLRVIGGLSSEALAQIKATQGNSPYHLAVMGSPAILNALDEDVLEPLDLDLIPNAANIIPAFLPFGYDVGVPVSYDGIGIAYNTETVETPPQTWADLWKPEYAGRIGMPRPSSNLGLAAVAVAAQIHGGSQDAMQVGLEKWHELDPLVGRSPPLLQQMLERGEIDLCVLWHQNTAIAASTGLPFAYAKAREPGPLMLPTNIVQFVNNGHSELVHEFADILLTPESQAFSAAAPFFFGPVVEGVESPPEAAPFVPDAQELGQLQSLDWPTLAPLRARMVEDFDRMFGM
ncbi:ABC transporter substrate-binding protein [Aureimonas populi]|uniref:PotD/PotF family extracellular solute-binding protein n=1 Tax=Aureimonas populi TaxID=1701758 RepID=A0ABW5CNQ6_9HYPH|nr:extracellular solute-binding protein [Aureimonas populi]